MAMAGSPVKRDRRFAAGEYRLGGYTKAVTSPGIASATLDVR
jgi:hypothetical protein